MTEIKDLDNIFGLKPQCGIDFIDSSTVLCATEKYLIVNDVETLERQTRKVAEKGEITAFCLSSTRFNVIVAVTQKEKHFIVVWQWENWKLLTKIPSETVNSLLKVSQEDIYLAAVSTGYSKTHFTVKLFNLESGQFLADINLACDGSGPTQHVEISFCPADQGLLLVVEQNTSTAKMLRYFAGSLQEFSKIMVQSEAFCHGWMEETTVVFGTKNEKLMFYHEKDKLNEVSLKKLSTDVFGDYSDLTPIELKSGNQIFICATRMGVIFLWSSPIQWNSTQIFVLPQIPGVSKVLSDCISISLNTTETTFVTSTYNCLYSMRFSRLVQEKIKTQGFEILTAFHSTDINSISAAYQIPRMISCDVNGLVIVQDCTNGNVISLHKFEDVVNSVSLHPCGYHVLITLSKIVSLYAICHGELTSLWNVASDHLFKHAEFGALGTLFIVASTNEVSMYNFDKLSCIWTYSISSVRKCFWRPQSTYLVVLTATCVCLMSVGEGKVLWNWSFKILDPLDLTTDTNGTVFLLCSDTLVYFVHNGEKNNSVSYGYGSAKCLSYHDKSLIIGTNNGRILITPSDKTKEQHDQLNYQCHTTGIQQITMWHNIVLTASGTNVGVTKFNNDTYQYLDGTFALCQRKRFNDCLRQAAELEAHVACLGSKTDEKLELQKNISQKEISHISNSSKNKEKILHDKIQHLQNQLADVTADFEATVEEMKNLYDQESEFQANQFHERLSAHVRKSDQIEAWYEARLNSARKATNGEQEQLKMSFRKTEMNWKAQHKRLENENEVLRTKIKRLVDELKRYQSFTDEIIDY